MPHALLECTENLDHHERPSLRHGVARSFGLTAAVDRISVHDLQVTIRRLLGIDHERFTYRFQGRRYWLTEVFGGEELQAHSSASGRATIGSRLGPSSSEPPVRGQSTGPPPA